MSSTGENFFPMGLLGKSLLGTSLAVGDLEYGELEAERCDLVRACRPVLIERTDRDGHNAGLTPAGPP